MFASRVRSLPHSRVARLVTAAGVSLAVTAGVLTLPTTSAQAAPVGPPKPYLGKIIPGKHWTAGAPGGHAATSVKPPTATVLSAVSSTLSLPVSAQQGSVPRTRSSEQGSAPEATVAGNWQQIGSTGIAAAAATGVAGGGGARASKVSVDVLDAAGAKKYGGALALRLERADGATGDAPVAVRIPKATLIGLFGADYASRVRWVEYPDTGGVPTDGTTAEAVPTTTVGGDTVLSPQVASAAPMMLAAAAGATSSTGTGSFGATSLSPSGEWQVSAQSGDFAWSYPLRVPPAAAGPAPSISFDYDSQTVDGETGSTNNQPSAIGDGWSLGGGGFIERSYVPCSLDNGPSGPVTTSGDLCWTTDNATLSLSGHSGRLVKDSATGAWKLQSDDGSRLEHLTGAGNGAQGGEYWRLTTTDGTQYYFGLNQLPGWASGKPSTNSAWTVPVYGNDPGEPCHASTFAASSCTQPWRWNLDYVVDPHGNAAAYYYSAETNRYAQDGSGATSYVRGGQLDHVDYGLTGGNVYGANAATDRVLFNYGNRCIPGATCDSAHPTSWPDVPWDQNCTAAPCNQVQPTFWSTRMLTGVSTQYWNGSGYATVDTWSLGHSFPDPGDGTSAALWLTQIGHTGNVGGSAITLPDVTFQGVAMQNRVWVIDGLAPLEKYRISSLTTETGAVISVNYSGEDCQPSEAATIEANANTNTRRCYPQWWTPQTTPPQPAKQDLFHKYVVTSVISDPRTGGANDRPQETDYVYTGTPAWRYDTSPLTPDKNRTWSSYAGYSTVEVRVGDHQFPAAQQTTAYTFFQGMDGDRASSSGGTKSVAVGASDGSSVPDSLWLAGRTREARTLNGVGGAVLSSTITTAWASGVTANDGVDTARMVGDGDVVSTAPLAAGGVRRTETQTSFDGYGRVTQVNALTPDAGATCTRTSYATSTSAWLIAFPAETSVVGTDCGTTPSYPADAVSDSRTIYDGGSPGSPPTKGDVTSTQVVKGYSGSTPVWLTTATSSYDAVGRVVSVTDPRAGLNRTTTTAYVPQSGGPVTQTVVTNPLGWTTTTSYAPAWGAETAVTDQNGHTTTATYDALGRRTAVWAPDRPQASNPTPSMAFAYTVSTSAPLSVTTTTLTAIGTVTGYVLYDGLGRQRQTQEFAEGGGTAVADTYYDAAGRVSQQNQPYYTTSVQPSGTLFVPSTTISGQELFTFDGAGRTVTDQQWVNGKEAWQTTYAYPGADRVDVTPPSGGTPTTTFANSLGKTTELVRYLAATPSATATQEATGYSYDARGDMIGMTDAAGNAWSWGFDVLGRETSATDPDTGTTATAYDDAGRAVSTTDARGVTLVSTYDALDRITALNQGSAGGPLLASWTFDTLSKGQPTSSTSYVGSTAGTPGTAYTQATTGYDAADRPTGHSTTLPAGTPMAGTYTTTFSYYQDGSLLQQVDPAMGGINAETLKYSYGSLGRMSGLVGSIAGVGSYTYAGGVAYTYLGQLAQYAQSRASQTFYRTFTWADGTNRLSELEGTLSNTVNTVTSDRHLTYDDAGNVTRQQTLADSTATDTQCFRYDQLRDLSQAWTPSSGNCATNPTAAGLGGPAPYWTTYTVNAATGNRTKTVEHSVTGGMNTTDTYAYPASGQPHPHAVTKVTHSGGQTGTDSYGTPDADGNAVTRPGQTLSYDPRGKLGSVTLTANGQKQTDVYDADGNLLVQSDSVNGTTAFLGDTQLHVAAGSSAVTASRTYTVNGSPSGERDTTAGKLGSTLYFLDADPLGTATAEVRATDGKITRRFQDPYGVARGTSATWSSARGYLDAPTSTFSDLTQLGARAYDSAIGRFISADPILDVADLASLAAYAYADNNPATNADPTGLLCTNGPDGMCVTPDGSHVNTPGVFDRNYASGYFPPAPGTASAARAEYEHTDARSVRDKYMDAQTGQDQFWYHDTSTLPNPLAGLIAQNNFYAGFFSTVADILMWQTNRQLQSEGYGTIGGDISAAMHADTSAFWYKAGKVTANVAVVAATAPLGGAGAAASATEVVAEESGFAAATFGGARFAAGADGTITDALGGAVANAASIGHYPAYVTLAEQTGARVFSISDDAWNAMSSAEQTVRNDRFLERGIAAGMEFRLATPLSQMRPQSAYENEIAYLLKRGYVFNRTGDALIPGGGQ